MKKEKITIKDIAREAKVSVGTVSNVINMKETVNSKIRERIERIIKKNNFRVNVSAKSLRKKPTKMIGIIVPDSINPLFAHINKAIEKIARKEGYSIVVCNSEYSYDFEIEYINILKSRDVDGIIFYPSIEKDNSFKILNDLNINTIIIERKLNNLNADFVMMDHYSSMREVVYHLVNMGHSRIAYIERESTLFNSRERLKGFIDSLKDSNLGLNKDYLITGDGFSCERGYEDTKKILRLSEKPTAIIAYNDVLAIGAMRALEDENIKVPEDISIVGGDNIFIDNFLIPRLTSVSFDAKKIAYYSIKTLLDRINGDREGQKNIIIPPSLIIRESTGRVKKK